MSLTQRSVRSVKWNTFATLFGFPLNFVQAIFLARLLPVEHFGIFAAMSSIIGVSSTFFEFGLSNAFLHRAPESQDEEHATPAFFTLRLIFDSVWLVFLLVLGLIAMSGTRQWVLIFLGITGYLNRFTSVPQVLLMRRVQHRRLAIISIAVNVSVTIISIGVAWLTHSIWALLVSSTMTLVIGWIGIYIWKPVWRPKLAWDSKIMRYFLGFGGRNMINNMLDGALDNSDNLWTSYFLGDLLLGYYSRAFRFAVNPRVLLSNPINLVAAGTFAELKYDRLRLSKAFFRTGVLLTRLGFLLAGLLAVIAPEFIVIFLGDKWLPMLTAFRLMLVFSLLDPLRLITSSVLMAVGKPEKASQVRLMQLFILGAGLFGLGFVYKISGVAMAMDLMVIFGILFSMRLIRDYVDFSILRLFIPPSLALLVGFGLSWLGLSFIRDLQVGWLTLALKTLIFCSGYLLTLTIMEGKTLYQSFSQIVDLPGMIKKVRLFVGL